MTLVSLGPVLSCLREYGGQVLNHPVSIVSGNDVGGSLVDRQIVEESTDRDQQKREGHQGARGRCG